jgi:putative transposase
MKRGGLLRLDCFFHKSTNILGWSLSITMEGEWVVDLLRTTVLQHGKPEIINSDQGSKFTSDEYVAYVKSLETVRISMDGKGRAIDNVYIERFWRTIKYDKLYLLELVTGRQVWQACDEFNGYYNSRRGHLSLDDKTPEHVYKSAA